MAPSKTDPEPLSYQEHNAERLLPKPKRTLIGDVVEWTPEDFESIEITGEFEGPAPLLRVVKP